MPFLQACDVFDLSEPRDILHELKKSWFEELGDKKWSIRKQALSEFKELASSPRLASGDYGDVCRELKKVRACGVVNSLVEKSDLDFGLSCFSEVCFCSYFALSRCCCFLLVSRL